MSRRVYFIRPIGMQGPIKIGCSYSPDGRLKTLANWSPFPLEIIAEIEGQTEIERRFHALFRDSHERHEWFTWTPELQAVIDAVAAGAFDVETLPRPLRITHASRDNRYSTPGWRYSRSVTARLWNLRRRGLPHNESRLSEIWKLNLVHAGPEALEQAKAYIEPIIAEWRLLYPTATEIRRAPELARVG